MSDTLFEAIDATWAPATITHNGPWLIRDGQGGGKRVSAVSACRTPSLQDIEGALDWPLFMIRPQDHQLDAVLAANGYQIIDPVDIFTCTPCARTTAYRANEHPSQIQTSIWAAGGIGPERLAVMARTSGPKAYLEVANATAFIALHKGIAMTHAVEVAQTARKQGYGGQIMAGALDWAYQHGAQKLALAVTSANKPAQNLYRALNMTIETHYHYRIKP